MAELIKEYDERFGHILGHRRMTSWINHFNHTSYSKNRVHRIMKELGIHSIIRKKKKKYQPSRPETTADNKLKRDFNAAAPNEKWATDVTECKNGFSFGQGVSVHKQGVSKQVSKAGNGSVHVPCRALY